jgi:hypothetical protein
MRHPLIGRHDGKDPVRFTSKIFQKGGGVAQAQNDFAPNARPQGPDLSANKVPRPAPHSASVKGIQINDISPHGLAFGNCLRGRESGCPNRF